MTTIPRAYVDNFTRVINGISDDAQKKLAKALEGVVIDDIAAARNEIIAIMDTLLGPYTDNVAAVAATFYDGLRAYFGIDDGFMAESESMREPAATAGAVRAFMQTQVDGKPFGVLENLLTERVDYECKRAANECIAYNAKNDPKRPKWARVPTGAETCEWCIMLASRGFAYLSEEAASHTHANCDCRVIPSWDKDNPAVQGYDPDLYYDMWKNPEKYKEQNSEEQNQSITFNLEGVSNSANTQQIITALANEYETSLQEVKPLPYGVKTEQGEVDLFTGMVMQLKTGRESVVTHEFAHTIWTQKRLEEYKPEGAAEFEKELKKIWKRYKNEALYEGELISVYSLHDINEFMAEAFACYKTGKAIDTTGIGADSIYTEQVGKLIDKYFKKRRNGK